MEKTTKIRALLRNIVGADESRPQLHLMEVVSVDGDLCTARIGNFEVPDIRLSSIGGGSENGLLLTPAAGSIILVADLSEGDLRELNAIGYSEITAVRLHQGKTTVEADTEKATMAVGESSVSIQDGKIAFNGDDNGGMVKIEELRHSLESLKTYCETLKTAITTGLNGVNEGLLASGKAGAGLFETSMAGVNIRIENMENKKVTH